MDCLHEASQQSPAFGKPQHGFFKSRNHGMPTIPAQCEH